MSRQLVMRRKLLAELELSLAELIKLIIELKKEVENKAPNSCLIKLVKCNEVDSDKAVNDSEGD